MIGNQLLTPAQSETLLYIKQYVKKNAQPPTMTELRTGLKLRSLRSVMQRIEALERKAFLKRNKFQHRSIMLLENADYLSDSGFIEVPVIASAGCDAMDVYAQDEFGEFITIDKKLVGDKSNIAAIRAVGDSMEDAGIRSGDYVVVEVTESVTGGDRVVAIVGNMAVIKRYSNQDGIVVLHPENKDAGYNPIVVRQEDSRIFGKVLSIIPGREWVDDIKIEYYDGFAPTR
ncbi:MAG: repressor LexA [Parcubacteria bacterium C7867-001]|nr:MAG: repressor LexA [Parcubacteria bacterium C7867-001]